MNETTTRRAVSKTVEFSEPIEFSYDRGERSTSDLWFSDGQPELLPSSEKSNFCNATINSSNPVSSEF